MDEFRIKIVKIYSIPLGMEYSIYILTRSVRDLLQSLTPNQKLPSKLP
jgi:hypothetical protein